MHQVTYLRSAVVYVSYLVVTIALLIKISYTAGALFTKYLMIYHKIIV